MPERQTRAGSVAACLTIFEQPTIGGLAKDKDMTDEKFYYLALQGFIILTSINKKLDKECRMLEEYEGI